MEEPKVCSHEDLRDEIREIKETLKPIAEAFNAVSKLGSWGKALLVVVSVIVGLFISIKNL